MGGLDCRWLYQNNKLKDMLELGASSPEAQRELELVLDVDKNARRLAWINQINARKYRYEKAREPQLCSERSTTGTG